MWQIFRFLTEILILSNISILDQNFDFWPKFQFLSKFSIFDKFRYPGLDTIDSGLNRSALWRKIWHHWKMDRIGQKNEMAVRWHFWLAIFWQTVLFLSGYYVKMAFSFCKMVIGHQNDNYPFLACQKRNRTFFCEIYIGW